MELRFGAKLSLGLSQMPLQVIFMGGSFEYTKMIGCGFEGGGVTLWPRSDSVSREIIHKFALQPINSRPYCFFPEPSRAWRLKGHFNISAVKSLSV